MHVWVVTFAEWNINTLLHSDMSTHISFTIWFTFLTHFCRTVWYLCSHICKKNYAIKNYSYFSCHIHRLKRHFYIVTVYHISSTTCFAFWHVSHTFQRLSGTILHSGHIDVSNFDSKDMYSTHFFLYLFPQSAARIMLPLKRNTIHLYISTLQTLKHIDFWFLAKGGEKNQSLHFFW